MTDAPPQPRSPLFRMPSRTNLTLARTLLNEMVRAGRSRTDMIDFVNCFLELVVQSAGVEKSDTSPRVDPQTGIPQRRALFDLLLHELNPEDPAQIDCALLWVRLDSDVDEEWVGRLLRHRLRTGDVLASLGRRRLGILAHVRADGLSTLLERLQSALRGHPLLQGKEPSVQGFSLRQGDTVRAAWKRMLKESR